MLFRSGINITPVQVSLAKGILGGFGVGATAEALFRDRAFDQNADGAKDSGADYWSSYLFHTRDIVRQSMLDYSQLVRVFRSFDGTARWKHDVNGDGQPELAGDFDADGVVDATDLQVGVTEVLMDDGIAARQLRRALELSHGALVVSPLIVDPAQAVDEKTIVWMKLDRASDESFGFIQVFASLRERVPEEVESRSVVGIQRDHLAKHDERLVSVTGQIGRAHV